MPSKLSIAIINRALLAKGHFDLISLNKNTRGSRKKNDKLLFSILNDNKNTEYGKKYNFANIKTVEDFRKNVPITTYKEYAPYIHRMIYENEKNLITSYKVLGYAKSSGTVGDVKHIPLTKPHINIYLKYSLIRALALADEYRIKTEGKHVKPGRGIYTLPSFDDYLSNGMLGSNVVDVAVKQLLFLHKYVFEIPFDKQFSNEEFDFRYTNCRFALENEDCLFAFGAFFKNITDLVMYLEQNWKMIIDDIEKGTINKSVMGKPEIREKLQKMVKPNPERAKFLRAEFEKGFDETILKRLWSNMAVLSSIGTASFAPFVSSTRKYAKGIPFDLSVYGASEGMFGAPDKLDSSNLLLLIDSAYYEFIDINNDDGKIYSLDELTVGNEYKIIITNHSGLYRYDLGDIIKVVGYKNECPYIVFSRREGQLLNIIGEKTNEEHMRTAINRLEKEAGVKIDDWTVNVCANEYPNYYKILIENKDNKDLSQYSEFVENELQKINQRYADFRNLHGIGLGPLKILNLQYGAQKAWVDHQVKKGASYFQTKPVRIIDNEDKLNFFNEYIQK